MTEVTAELADRIAVAVDAVPGVAGRDGGTAGEVATYLPGRRVTGVRIGRYDRIEVHIVVAYGAEVFAVAEAVRTVVAGLIGAEPVDVVVADIAAPGGDDPGR